MRFFNCRSLCTAIIALSVTGSSAGADDLDELFEPHRPATERPSTEAVGSPSDRRASDHDPSDRRLTNTAQPSARREQRSRAKQILQRRALRVTRNRMARLEMYQWAGYSPLRPRVGAMPFSRSHYSNRRTVVVPVYTYGP